MSKGGINEFEVKSVLQKQKLQKAVSLDNEIKKNLEKIGYQL